MPKMRLDALLVERGLVESRARAQALIMAGEVRLEGEVALKPGTAVSAEAQVEVMQGPRFVSRGGEKLDSALEVFELDTAGRVCADVGASTGGFTDCLLQRGAARVYAIDVGKGILHWKLRQDRRVVVMEQTNARFLEHLPEPVSLITVDASFISLRVLLPVIRLWLPAAELGGPADIVALIKPQFEAGRREVSRGKGVIRDEELHRKVLSEVLQHAETQELQARALMQSPLVGPKGNIEFLAWLVPGSRAGPGIEELIESVFAAPTKARKSIGYTDGAP
jgi:23S rRNA (cytidine1920-2'-O)/16S rRNA (cytidine1409-2'-O)-methyltransferase